MNSTDRLDYNIGLGNCSQWDNCHTRDTRFMSYSIISMSGGILELLYSFPYKLTSISGEWGTQSWNRVQVSLGVLKSGPNSNSGGPKRFWNHLSTQNNLYIWGFYAYFHPKMQNFEQVCVITWIIHSQSKNDKIQFLKFSHDYT